MFDPVFDAVSDTCRVVCARSRIDQADPLSHLPLTQVDRRLLASLGLTVLAHDDAGKRLLAGDDGDGGLEEGSSSGGNSSSDGGGGGGSKGERRGMVLFFMPHCPRRLYSNLLWANWRPRALPSLVVAGNR